MKNKINSKLIQEEYDNHYDFFNIPQSYLLLLSDLCILDDMEDWSLYQKMMKNDENHYDVLEQKCLFKNGSWELLSQ